MGLNQKGRRQARNLASELPDCTFDIFSSPLRRATETLDELIGAIDVHNRHELDEFKELNQGYWNGLRGDWLMSTDSQRYERWVTEPLETSPPAGESLHEVRERVARGLEEVLETGRDPILIVAHKVVNSLITHLLEDRPLADVLETLPENAQVKKLTASTENLKPPGSLR